MNHSLFSFYLGEVRSKSECMFRCCWFAVFVCLVSFNPLYLSLDVLVSAVRNCCFGRRAASRAGDDSLSLVFEFFAVQFIDSESYGKVKKTLRPFLTHNLVNRCTYTAVFDCELVFISSDFCFSI